MAAVAERIKPTEEQQAAARAVKITAPPAPDQAPPTPEAVAAPTPVPLGPMAPKRVKWIKLHDEYAGFEMQVWINHPQAIFDQIFSPDDEVSGAASKQVFIEHNGWRDHNGEPYPPMSEPLAFWTAIPTELGSLMVTALRREQTVLPNSLLPARGR